MSNVVEIDSGLDQTCSRKSNGEVWCWGGNGQGQLGDASNTNRSSPVWVSTLAASAISVSAGDGFLSAHSCAVLADGRVQCWGGGTQGQLGNNGTSSSNVPVTVKITAATNLTGALEVAVGGSHACARTLSSVRCWGKNTYGQLGTGNNDDSTVALLVSGLTDPSRIMASTTHTCVRRTGQSVSCWGYNGYGQLGNTTTDDSSLPVTSTGVVALSISGSLNGTNSLSPTGGIQSWGTDNVGELGDGLPYAHSSAAVNVTGIAGATALGGGRQHVCAVVAGDVGCWASNTKGQLGNGTQTDQTSPVTVAFP